MSFSIQRNKKVLHPIIKNNSLIINNQNFLNTDNIENNKKNLYHNNIENDKINYDNIECCVCYNNLNILITECSHPVCLDCLLKLRKIECPMCRNELLTLPKCIKVMIPGYQPPQIIRFDDI